MTETTRDTAWRCQTCDSAAHHHAGMVTLTVQHDADELVERSAERLVCDCGDLTIYVTVADDGDREWTDLAAMLAAPPDGPGLSPEQARRVARVVLVRGAYRLFDRAGRVMAIFPADPTSTQ